jgi:ABC-type nickel/cobalt efflux system permease component RcnA
VKTWERLAVLLVCLCSAAITVLFFTIVYFIVRDALR